MGAGAPGERSVEVVLPEDTIPGHGSPVRVPVPDRHAGCLGWALGGGVLLALLQRGVQALLQNVPGLGQRAADAFAAAALKGGLGGQTAEVRTGDWATGRPLAGETKESEPVPLHFPLRLPAQYANSAEYAIFAQANLN